MVFVQTAQRGRLSILIAAVYHLLLLLSTSPSSLPPCACCRVPVLSVADGQSRITNFRRQSAAEYLQYNNDEDLR